MSVCWFQELCQCRPGEGNCSCCKECMLCLGTLWDECCDCVGKFAFFRGLPAFFTLLSPATCWAHGLKTEVKHWDRVCALSILQFVVWVWNKFLWRPKYLKVISALWSWGWQSSRYCLFNSCLLILSLKHKTPFWIVILRKLYSTCFMGLDAVWRFPPAKGAFTGTALGHL